MPHESVLSMEILTGDGRVVTATPDGEHADLYHGFPNSYGTLGYALSLTIELEPVKPFVHLRHFRFDRPAVLYAGRGRESRAPAATQGSQGRLRRRHRVRAGRDVPDGRVVQRRRAVAQRLHQGAHLLPVDPRPAGRLPHRSATTCGAGTPTGSGARGRSACSTRSIRRLWPRRYRRSDVYRKLVAWYRQHDIDARRGQARERGSHPGRRDSGRALGRVPGVLPDRRSA